MAKRETTMAMRRDYARMLYLKDNPTQAEIADRVGTSPQTIVKWKADGKWESLKANYVISREETLSRTYAQINQIFDSLEEFNLEGGRVTRTIKPSEADTLSKLAATAKALETELSISIYIDVFIKFGNWLRDADFTLSKKMVELQDAFIKEQLRSI
jgi:DNA-binding XRE family transcriptional regulator